MIEWQRAKFNPIKHIAKVIVWLENGEVYLGMPATTVPIYAWASLEDDSTNVTWSHGIPPMHRPCLIITSDGVAHIGKAMIGMSVSKWSLINNPIWLRPKIKGSMNRIAGQDHPKAKLTDDACKKIRMEYVSGEKTYSQIAIEYGCSKSTVRDIIKGNTRYFR